MRLGKKSGKKCRRPEGRVGVSQKRNVVPTAPIPLALKSVLHLVRHTEEFLNQRCARCSKSFKRGDLKPISKAAIGSARREISGGLKKKDFSVLRNFASLKSTSAEEHFPDNLSTDRRVCHLVVPKEDPLAYRLENFLAV